jgi:ATP-binding cassette subfamily B multidrug efflux pump
VTGLLNVLNKLKWFFGMYRKRYALAVGLLIFCGILEMVPPQLLGIAIDEIHQGSLNLSGLIRYMALFVGFAAVIYALTYFWIYQLFGGSFLIEKILRHRFMSHLLKMTPKFYERNRTGDLMARATNDLKAVSQTTGFGILTLVDSSVFLIVVLVTMAVTISWKLTLAAMLPLPFIALTLRILGQKLHDNFMIAQDAFGVMNDAVLESVSGVRVIRAYVQERADQGRFREITDDVYEKNAAVARIDSLFEPILRILIGSSYMIGLGYGVYLVFKNSITLGELVSFNVYLGFLIWPMFAIGELMNIMQRGDASLDRVNETLSYTPDVVNDQQVRHVGTPNGIELRQVTFRYPSSESDNLTNVSLTLPKGHTLGIVGRTGSGKTTLLKQLIREYPIGSGDIVVSREKLEQIALEELHSWIGYVPQEQMLFSKSVRDNIRFGDPDATDEKVLSALDLAAFSQDIGTLSEGLDTLVGERGVALSGGQKQRVSLARALIADPEILILDDAMSAVDARTEARIIANIRQTRTGKTTLISTHRLSAVQHANEIIVLDGGRITERGTHEELMRIDGWYKEQFMRQQAEANLGESG